MSKRTKKRILRVSFVTVFESFKNKKKKENIHNSFGLFGFDFLKPFLIIVFKI